MAFVLERLPTNDDELWWTVKALWNVQIPRTKVCPDHIAPFEAFADAYFGRDGSIALWHGSRGLSGKSFTLSILGLTKSFLLGADTNLLGGSLAQSANIHEAMRSALEQENAPRYMVQTESQTLIKLSNKARIRPLTASQKTVRGPHPPFLLLDEIDEMDINILNAALGQPLPQKSYLGHINKPYTVLCSTWQNPEGTFTEKKREFESKGLPIKTWCASGNQTTSVITDSGDKWIEDITTEDRVLTRSGYKPVQHCTYVGDKQCYEIVAGGNRLLLTGDHEVFTTNRGWVQASLLRSLDSVVVTKTGAAVTPAIRTDIEVGSLIGVTLRAGSAGELLLDPATALGVDALAHRLQVLGIHTVGAVAGVVQTLGSDLPDLPSVDHPVNEHLAPRVAAFGHTTVSTGINVASPQPAGVINDGALAQPIIAQDSASGIGSAGTTTSGTLADGTMAIYAVHIDSVTPRAIYPVYDLGVEEVHEFIANGIVVHNCYRESMNPVDGWLDPETVEAKKREIPIEMWRVEYELGEPSIGNRAFDAESVERAFSRPMEPLERNESKEYEEFTFQHYTTSGTYVAAADWAKEQDFTVISVLRVDKHPYELVYWLRLKRRPYPVMIGMFNDAIAKYNAAAIHDATGLGNVVNDYLDTRARGFTMTGEKRSKMLSEYVSSVERGDMMFPKIPSAYLAHKYARYGDLYENAKDYHLPDEVCSLALAIKHARANGLAAPAITVPKDHKPNKFEAVFEAHKHEQGAATVTGVVELKDDINSGISLLV